MKHTKHEYRKSFEKWAMPRQRTQTLAATELDYRRFHAVVQGRANHLPNIGRNNGPIKHSVPGQIASQHLPAFLGMIKGHNGLLARSLGRSNHGVRVPSRGKIIPSHEYCPRWF